MQFIVADFCFVNHRYRSYKWDYFNLGFYWNLDLGFRKKYQENLINLALVHLYNLLESEWNRNKCLESVQPVVM